MTQNENQNIFQLELHKVTNRLITFGDFTKVYIQRHDDFNLSDIPNYIDGDLVITSSTNTETTTFSSLKTTQNQALNILPNLLGINGSIYIVNTNYHQITGFDKLEYIRGDVVIANNSNLTNFMGFSSTCSTNRVIIANNTVLKKVIGFESLNIATEIHICDNSELSHICAFTSLSQTSNLVITRNPNLSDITGFTILQQISESMVISNNSNQGNQLTINAFHALANSGSITLVKNLGLREITMERLHSSGNIVITDNRSLQQLNFPVLHLSETIIVAANPELQSVVFTNLRMIRGSLLLIANGISNLTTLDNLRFLSGSLTISANPLLVNIASFTNLEHCGHESLVVESTIESDDTIMWQTIYPQIVPFEPVFQYTVRDLVLELKQQYNLQTLTSIVISDNPVLKNINAFLNTSVISGKIKIIDNPQLERLSFLSRITWLIDLIITGNPEIKIITGLSELVNARSIEITTSPKLELLKSFKSLRHSQSLKLESSHMDSIIGIHQNKNVAEGVLTYHQI